MQLLLNSILIFSLFIIKINKGVEVINLIIGGAEFQRQDRGGGSQGLLGQNWLHLSLDPRLLRLQLPYNQSRFLQGKDNILKINKIMKL